MIIFSGSANVPLAQAICKHLQTRLGNAKVSSFSDNETRVEIHENVRGQDVYIIQSTSNPTNQHIMELLIMVDALRRSAAKTITAVIPYYGYSRQDRRPAFDRVPITASLVANMLSTAGVDHVVTMDLHAQQIQGFFDIPIINTTAATLFVNDIERRWLHTDTIIVSPDVGGVARARSIAKQIGNGQMDLAIIDKRRQQVNEAEVMNIIGDVAGKTCIMIDDIVDTAGTLCKAAAALVEHGATSVIAYCTHAVLSGPALDNIKSSKFDQMVITDSIFKGDELDNLVKLDKVRILDTAPTLAETIRRINACDSVSQLYTKE